MTKHEYALLYLRCEGSIQKGLARLAIAEHVGLQHRLQYGNGSSNSAQSGRWPGRCHPRWLPSRMIDGVASVETRPSG